jgi:hypothetical protein
MNRSDSIRRPPFNAFFTADFRASFSDSALKVSSSLADIKRAGKRLHAFSRDADRSILSPALQSVWLRSLSP